MEIEKEIRERYANIDWDILFLVVF